MGVTINSLQRESKDLSDKIRDSKVKSEKLKKTWDSQPNRTRRSLGDEWVQGGMSTNDQESEGTQEEDSEASAKKTQDSQRSQNAQ